MVALFIPEAYRVPKAPDRNAVDGIFIGTFFPRNGYDASGGVYLIGITKNRFQQGPCLSGSVRNETSRTPFFSVYVIVAGSTSGSAADV